MNYLLSRQDGNDVLIHVIGDDKVVKETWRYRWED